MGESAGCIMRHLFEEPSTVESLNALIKARRSNRTTDLKTHGVQTVHNFNAAGLPLDGETRRWTNAQQTDA